MKKIVITITNNISFDQRMLKIAEHYSKSYSVCIVGSNTRNPPHLEKRSFKQKRLNTVFQKGVFFYAEFNLRLFIYLLFNRQDIIYSVDLDTLLAGSLASRLKRKPYIFDAHEYFTELPELNGRTFVQKVWSWIEAKGVPRASACLTVNKELAEIFSKKFKKVFHVVRNVPLVISKEVPLKENVFIYQGALNKGRGVEQLIEMMGHFPDYTLEIAGDGPLKDELQQLQIKLDINNIRFHGMLSPDKLAQLTSTAKLGFNLLLGESLNYYYSLANKFFDYVMMETPVVTMSFPVYKRLMEEYEVGVLVDDLNVNNLVRQVNGIISSPLHYEKYVDECKEAKKEWNWAIESIKLDELISI